MTTTRVPGARLRRMLRQETTSGVLLLVAALAALVWIAGALLLPLIPARWRSPVLAILIAAGVPTLGWLTYCCGPGIGFAAFLAGVLTLALRPLGGLGSDRRRAGLQRTSD